MAEKTEMFEITEQRDEHMTEIFISCGSYANTLLATFCSTHSNKYFLGSSARNGQVDAEIAAKLQQLRNPVTGLIVDIDNEAIEEAIAVVRGYSVEIDVLILIENDEHQGQHQQRLEQLIQLAQPRTIHRGTSQPADALLALYADQLNRSLVCLDFADIYATLWGANEFYLVKADIPDGIDSIEFAQTLFKQFEQQDVSRDAISGALLSVSGCYQRRAFELEQYEQYSNSVSEQLPELAAFCSRTSGVPASVTKLATALLWVAVKH